MKTRSIGLVVVAMVLTASASSALAPERKCRDAIRKGGLTAASLAAIALGSCEQKAVAKGLPVTDCAADPKVLHGLDKANGKLARAITSGCAGKDKDLAAGGDDVPLADVGWDLGTCPDRGDGACVAPIATHDDVVTCLQCIVGDARDGIFAVAFHDLAPPDPAADGVRKCRAAIGKAAVLYAKAKRTRLAECWQALSKRGSGSLCPTNVAANDIAKARGALAARVAKVCLPTLTPATIGFPATCPDVTPVDGTTCAGPVTTLAAAAECVACVIDHHTDCADRGAVPNFVHPPSECVVPPAP